MYLLQHVLSGGETSLSSVFSEVVRQLGRNADADVVAYAATLTAKDIYCSIASLTSNSTFDYYDLTVARSKACSAISASEWQAMVAAATNARLAALLPLRVKVRYCFIIFLTLCTFAFHAFS